jgi:hypothetical protein
LNGFLVFIGIGLSGVGGEHTGGGLSKILSRSLRSGYERRRDDPEIIPDVYGNRLVL